MHAAPAWRERWRGRRPGALHLPPQLLDHGDYCYLQDLYVGRTFAAAASAAR